MKKTIAIIAAMPQEFDILEAALENKSEYLRGKLKFVSGILEQQQVVLALSGIGKVNAAVATAIAIEKFNAEVVINTGSAGGLGADMKMGDIVIATQVAHHDVNVTAFGHEIGQVPQLPRYFASSPRLIEKIKDAADAFEHGVIYKGLILSGDQFIADSKTVSEFKNQFSEPLACEMEAAAIAQTCYVLDVPFLIVRAISDNANETASMSFDEFIVLAGAESAKMVRELVKNWD